MTGDQHQRAVEDTKKVMNYRYRACRRCKAIDTLWTERGCNECDVERFMNLCANSAWYAWLNELCGIRYLTKSGRLMVKYSSERYLPKVLRNVIRQKNFDRLVALKVYTVGEEP